MASHTSELIANLVDNVSKPARTVAQALKQAEAEMKAVGRAMSDAGGGSDRFIQSLAKLKLSATDIKTVAAAWKEYAAANNLAADASQWTSQQQGQVRAWRAQTISAMREVTAERRAAARSMQQIARQEQQQQERVFANRRRWFAGDTSRMAYMYGTGAVGFGTLRGVKETVKAGADLSQERFRLRMVSRSDLTEAPFAESLASEIATKYPSITQAEALRMYTELRANAGATAGGPISKEIARKNMLVAAQAKAASLALGFEFTAEDTQNLLKAMETSGRASDPQGFAKITDAYIRAKQVYGTAINTQAARDFVMNAKAANFSFSDQTFYRDMWVRMSEGSPQRLGNQAAQTLQTLGGGRMTKQTAQWLQEHGLLPAGSVSDQGGGWARAKTNITRADLLQTAPGQWATEILLPSLMGRDITPEAIEARKKLLRSQEKPGQHADEAFLEHMSVEGLVAASLMKMGARTTVSDNLIHWIANEILVKRGTAQMEAAAGPAEAAAGIGQNAAATWKEFTQSLVNLSSVAGSPGVELAAKGLHNLAESIASFQDVITKWEAANKDIAGPLSLAGMGAATGVGGYLTLRGLTAVTDKLGITSNASGTLKGGVSWLKNTLLGESALMGSSFAGAIAAGTEAGNKEAMADPELIRQLANSDRRKQENFTKYGWLGGSAYNFGESFGWTPTRLPGAVPPSPVGYGAMPTGAQDPAQMKEQIGLMEQAKEKADELHTSISQPAHPEIDLSGFNAALDAAQAKWNAFKASISSLGTSLGASLPNLGPVQRGNFSHGGIGHE